VHRMVLGESRCVDDSKKPLHVLGLTTEPITAAWSPSSCFLSLLRLAVIEFWLNGALTSVPSNTAICKTVFRSLLRDQVCSAACDSLRQTCLQHAGVQSSDSKRVEAYNQTATPSSHFGSLTYATLAVFKVSVHFCILGLV
jgi:hypothetical protein